MDSRSKHFEAIRREGIMGGSLANLTGETVAAALKALINTLTNAPAMAAERPEIIEDLFAKLGAIEGAANNLRGPLFELIVAHCVREREGNSVDVGRPIRDPTNGRATDIDVLRVKENQEVASYECRGHGPNTNVSVDEVNRWLTVTIPKIQNYLRAQERFERNQFIFEFWTTGKFSDAAIRCLTSAQEKTKKYQIHWKDGAAVVEYAKVLKSPHIVRVLDEHYLKHPITRIAAGTARAKSAPLIGPDVAAPS